MAFQKYNPGAANVPHAQGDDFFISAEEFKGLNPDYWVEIAVRQCLRVKEDQLALFPAAVEMLENTMVLHIEKNGEYKKRIAEYAESLKHEPGVSDDQIPALMAPFKFRELMRVVDTIKAEEEGYEV